jgi:hypothetical protein
VVQAEQLLPVLPLCRSWAELQELLQQLGLDLGRATPPRSSSPPRMGEPAVSILESVHIDWDVPMSRLFLSRN